MATGRSCTYQADHFSSFQAKQRILLGEPLLSMYEVLAMQLPWVPAEGDHRYACCMCPITIEPLRLGEYFSPTSASLECLRCAKLAEFMPSNVNIAVNKDDMHM